jgi:hypothetical protein
VFIFVRLFSPSIKLIAVIAPTCTKAHSAANIDFIVGDAMNLVDTRNPWYTGKHREPPTFSIMAPAVDSSVGPQYLFEGFKYIIFGFLVQ